MPIIHTLDNTRPVDNNNYNIFQSRTNFDSGLSSLKSPYENTWFEIVFPDLKVFSFTFISSIILSIVHIIVIFSTSTGSDPNSAELIKFGALNGPLVQDGQIWRLLTPVLLHTSLVHIMFNLYVQVTTGAVVEKKHGTLVMSAIYILSALGGNCLSAAVLPCRVCAGASTAIFGILTVKLMDSILDSRDGPVNQAKDLQSIVLFIVFVVTLSLINESTDFFGHLGGIVVGAAFGALLNINHTTYTWIRQQKFTIIGILGLYYIGCLLVIYLIPMRGPNGRCVS